MADESEWQQAPEYGILKSERSKRMPDPTYSGRWPERRCNEILLAPCAGFQPTHSPQVEHAHNADRQTIARYGCEHSAIGAARGKRVLRAHLALSTPSPALTYQWGAMKGGKSMIVLKLLITGLIALLFVLLLGVKLVAKATGGYDSTEHWALNAALLVVGLATLASIAAL